MSATNQLQFIHNLFNSETTEVPTLLTTMTESAGAQQDIPNLPVVGHQTNMQQAKWPVWNAICKTLSLLWRNKSTVCSVVVGVCIGQAGVKIANVAVNSAFIANSTATVFPTAAVASPDPYNPSWLPSICTLRSPDFTDAIEPLLSMQSSRDKAHSILSPKVKATRKGIKDMNHAMQSMCRQFEHSAHTLKQANHEDQNFDTARGSGHELHLAIKTVSEMALKNAEIGRDIADLADKELVYESRRRERSLSSADKFIESVKGWVPPSMSVWGDEVPNPLETILREAQAANTSQWSIHQWAEDSMIYLEPYWDDEKLSDSGWRRTEDDFMSAIQGFIHTTADRVNVREWYDCLGRDFATTTAARAAPTTALKSALTTTLGPTVTPATEPASTTPEISVPVPAEDLGSNIPVKVQVQGFMDAVQIARDFSRLHEQPL